MSFYFAGMRPSNVLRLRWSSLQDGRLHYTMGKNHKPGTVKISEKATHILDQYKPLADEEEGPIIVDPPVEE